jgi:methionyl aminopeptidase
VIRLKAPHELMRIQAAGRLVAQAHRSVAEMVEPGLETRQIDVAVGRLFREAGATSAFLGAAGVVPYPALTCVSVNEQVVHGIPSGRKLKRGDVVSVDIGCRLDGWCADSAWTYPVGPVDEEKQRLLAVGVEALQLAISELGRQTHWLAVARPMEELVRRAGFSVVEELGGHGIGRELHEDPQVLNYVPARLAGCDFGFVPGLAVAIEPVVNAGSRHIERSRSDHWTIVTRDRRPSVHFEHTVAITATGPLVLTGPAAL